MEQQINNTPMVQENAPYSVATLVLGIMSILSGCFSVGLILGIIGTVLGSKGLKVCDANTTQYKNRGMLTAGKTMSIIGIVFGALSLVWLIICLIAGFAYMDWITDIFDL
ncbi:MAG: hypothetical protein IJU81_02185 [Bacteroidales bacterium]|nr:hypothetical protein [Bacteroidales bacterium]